MAVFYFPRQVKIGTRFVDTSSYRMIAHKDASGGYDGTYTLEKFVDNYHANHEVLTGTGEDISDYLYTLYFGDMLN